MDYYERRAARARRRHMREMRRTAIECVTFGALMLASLWLCALASAIDTPIGVGW